MSWKGSLAAATLAVATLPLSTTAWAEACIHGICATSVTNGGFVSVRYHVQNGPVSHVNIRSTQFQVANCEGICPDINQREGGPQGTFTLIPRQEWADAIFDPGLRPRRVPSALELRGLGGFQA